MRASTCLLLSFAVACHSSSASHETDASNIDAAPPGGDAPPVELGALMPQEVPGDPNAAMATPNVVAITYNTDTSRSDIEAFYNQYAASPAWALQTAEYGIGALSVGTPIHLSGSPPASDTALHSVSPRTSPARRRRGARRARTRCTRSRCRSTRSSPTISAIRVAADITTTSWSAVPTSRTRCSARAREAFRRRPRRSRRSRSRSRTSSSRPRPIRATSTTTRGAPSTSPTPCGRM